MLLARHRSGVSAVPQQQLDQRHVAAARSGVQCGEAACRSLAHLCTQYEQCLHHLQVTLVGRL